MSRKTVNPTPVLLPSMSPKFKQPEVDLVQARVEAQLEWLLQNSIRFREDTMGVQRKRRKLVLGR